MIRAALEDDGAALAHCGECDELVAVNKYGLACRHDPGDASALDAELFEDRTRFDRIRDGLSSALERVVS